MRQSTENFCKLWESKQNTREAIKSQVAENRFYGYAQSLKTNPKISELAKAAKEKELAAYIKNNNGNLGIPVKLTDLGIRRMATALVLMHKED